MPMPNAQCPMPKAQCPMPNEHLMLLRKAIDTSYKKKRSRDITPAQKTENQSKAKKRIFCRAFN